MDEKTIKQYEERFEENYDVQDDPLYNAWLRLKQHALPRLDSAASTESDQSNPLPEFKSLAISPAFDEVLQYPNPVPRKTSNRSRGASQMPCHLTSDQVIQFLADKRKKKLEAEEAKAQRKVEREAKKAERERKKSEREHQKAEREAQRLASRGRRGRGKSRRGVKRSFPPTPMKTLMRRYRDHGK